MPSLPRTPNLAEPCGEGGGVPAVGSGVGLVCLPACGGGGTTFLGCRLVMEIPCASGVGGVRPVPSTITPARPPLVSGRKVKGSLSAPAYITEKIIVKAYLVENITERLYGWDEHASVACLSAGVWMLALLIGNCCLGMHLLYSTPFHRACLD